MPGTYPDYTANTQDTSNDIPGRTDIANAADYNDHDREILKHQDWLKNHQSRIVVLESGGAVTYLKDLLDVNAPTPTGWQCLSYDSATSKWINRTINEGSQGPTGPQGPAGATGSTGPQGPAGADGAGTAPSGANTDIQFNDNGVFGGDGCLIWDKDILRLATKNIWASGYLWGDEITANGAITIYNTGGNASFWVYEGTAYLAGGYGIPLEVRGGSASWGSQKLTLHGGDGGGNGSGNAGADTHLRGGNAGHGSIVNTAKGGDVYIAGGKKATDSTGLDGTVYFGQEHSVAASVDSSGNIVANTINASGNVTAVSYYGDGSHLTGISSGGGTPSGVYTSVQFNDSGAFGGDSDLTYDKGSNTLYVYNMSASGDMYFNAGFNKSFRYTWTSLANQSFSITETNLNEDLNKRGICLQTNGTNLILGPYNGAGHVFPLSEQQNLGEYTDATHKGRWNNLYLKGFISDGTNTVTMGNPVIVSGGVAASSGYFSQPVYVAIASGNAPLEVVSPTVNTNLNADMLDGKHASDFASAGSVGSLQQVTNVGKTTTNDITAAGVTVSYDYASDSPLLTVSELGGSYLTIQALNTTISEIRSYNGIRVFPDISDAAGAGWIDSYSSSTLNRLYFGHNTKIKGGSGNTPPTQADGYRLFLEGGDAWSVAGNGGDVIIRGGIGATVVANPPRGSVIIDCSGIMENITTKSITASGNIYAESGDIKMDDLRALRYGATKLLYGDTSWRNYFYGNAGNTYMAAPGCIGIGNHALSKNIDGWYNTAIGDDALENTTTGGYNIAIGPGVLSVNTTGTSNTAMGWVSMNENVDGSANTAIGPYTLVKNISGANNTAVGPFALYANLGDNNTGIGNWTLGSTTTGSYNSAIGYRTMQFNKTGGYNTAIGFGALRSGEAPSYNTAVGLAALAINNGTGNTAIGNYAGVDEYRSNTFYISNRDHYDFEGGKRCSIVYGNFGPNNTNIAGQELFLNADTYIQASGIFTNVSTNSITASGNIAASGSIEASGNIMATAYYTKGTPPVADGTYTMGLKLTPGGVNGTITVSGGIIIAIQQAT